MLCGVTIPSLLYFIFLIRKQDEYYSNLCDKCKYYCNCYYHYSPLSIIDNTLSFPDNPPPYRLFSPPSYKEAIINEINS